MIVGMTRLWSFLSKKKNREILAWVGGGAAAVIGAFWAGFVYFVTPQKAVTNNPNVEASCGSIVFGQSVVGSTITAGNTGNCPEQKSTR